MDDKDRVFARFKDDKPQPSERRELLTIQRRAGGSGNRVVEVVRLQSDGTVRDRPQRSDPYVRAASWEGGFPARQAAAAPSDTTSVPIADTPVPTTHVMPAWEPTAKFATDSATTETQVNVAPRGRGRPRKHPIQEAPGSEAGGDVASGRTTADRPHPSKYDARARRVADPFDIADDGANCMRCGYAIETGREKRGMMTCAKCA